MFVYSVEQLPADVDKGGDAHHIVGGEVHEGLSQIFTHIAQMFLYGFLPPANNINIISHQHVKRAQLHHFLQTHHYHIGLIYRKIEQFIQISLRYFFRVNSIAIPGQNIHNQLIVIVVFGFV